MFLARALVAQLKSRAIPASEANNFSFIPPCVRVIVINCQAQTLAQKRNPTIGPRQGCVPGAESGFNPGETPGSDKRQAPSSILQAGTSPELRWRRNAASCSADFQSAVSPIS